jgi:hypothetical protein
MVPLCGWLEHPTRSSIFMPCAPNISQYWGQTRFCWDRPSLRQNGSFGAGNETRTRDLNLGKIVPRIIQAFDLDKNYAFYASLDSAQDACQK